MDPVYKNRSQIGSLLRKLDEVNGGAFIFKLALLGVIPFFFLYADDGKPQEAPQGDEVIDIGGENSPTDANGTITSTDANGTITSTDANGTVASTDANGTIASTDANGTSMTAIPKEREIPATLGPFSVIPRNDPFRLIKPQKEESKPKIVTPPRTVGVPQLSGISTLHGTNKAVLRISPPSGGKAEYVFLKEGEELHGVEVIKIEAVKDANKTSDSPEWTVEVLVRGQTFNLELDKLRFSSSKSSRSSRSSRSSSSRPSGSSGRSTTPVRSSGSNYRPGFGKETTKPTTPDDKKPPSPPKPPGNGLKTVPTRGGAVQPSLEYPSRFGAEMYEQPPFDSRLQQLITDPAQLSAQREIIRGQYSREVPTDLPAEER